MDPQAVNQAQISHAMAAILPAFFFLGLLITAAIIVPFWVAFKKAGMPGPLSLMVLIPGIGFLLTLYVLAFAKWKVVPAPEYAYPGQLPPSGYPPVSAHPPVYAQSPVPGAPPAVGYNAPGAYTPATQAYPPPPNPPTDL